MAAGKRAVLFETPSKVYVEEEPTDWNQLLRHAVTKSAQTFTVNNLPTLVAISAQTILSETLQQISLLREMKKIPFEDVSLQETNYDMELLLNDNESFYDLRKFSRDVCWLEKILSSTITNLKTNQAFDALLEVIVDQENVLQIQETLISSQLFNQKEIMKLRMFLDSEKLHTSKRIQELTEKLGNYKDQLNDDEAEYKVKLKYLKTWQNSRHEQNKMTLANQEGKFLEERRKLVIDYDRENRIHEEMVTFLTECEEDYKQGIQEWMERYDQELEMKEQQEQNIILKIDQQRESHLRLKQEYEKRQHAMEAYIEHKRRKQLELEEIQRRTDAATKIQSWWRAIMFRKGLGPFRRKKGKGKKK